MQVLLEVFRDGISLVNIMDKKFKKIRYDINEEQLERIRKVTKKIETTHIVQIINKIPPFNSDDTESSKAREFFKKEKELYEKGKENYWESRKLLLTHNKKNLSLIQESYRKRLLGWSNYHIGYQKIPDPEGRSNNPYLRGLEAREAFIEVLRLAVSREDVDSVLSGLPLVYYFLCIEPEKAFKVAEEAEKKCWNKAPLYNSIALLKREEKKHIEALQYFSYAFKEGEKLQDYRTCGNALNNKARILKYSFFQYKELGVQRELLIELKKEILSQFEKSKEQYKKDEEVNGHSAKFHLEGIDKQIKELETT